MILLKVKISHRGVAHFPVAFQVPFCQWDMEFAKAKKNAKNHRKEWYDEFRSKATKAHMTVI